MTRERTLSVNIPSAWKTGVASALLARARPACGGGPPGDLAGISSKLRRTSFFSATARTSNIAGCPISMASAALGGEFEVPAIDGSKVRVKVPPGTQTGGRFRLAGKGMPVLRSKQTGDSTFR